MTGTRRPGGLYSHALSARNAGCPDLSTWRALVLADEIGRATIVATDGDLDRIERLLATAWDRAGRKAQASPAWDHDDAAEELARTTETAWRTAHVCAIPPEVASILRAIVTEARRLGLVRVSIARLRFVELTGLTEYRVRKGIDLAVDLGLVRIVLRGRSGANAADRQAARYRLTTPRAALPLTSEARQAISAHSELGRAQAVEAALSTLVPHLPPIRSTNTRRGSLGDAPRLSGRDFAPGSLGETPPLTSDDAVTITGSPEAVARAASALARGLAVDADEPVDPRKRRRHLRALSDDP